MATCAFIGDEWTAAGFRLAGLDAYSPAADELPNLFRELLDNAELVILTAERAAEIPQAELARALQGPRPLVLVMADAAYRRLPEDLAASLRQRLGMSA
jgi:vacuolar-type H+-ATPase subunit F/Vma7